MKRIATFLLLTLALSAFGFAEDVQMKNVSKMQPAADAKIDIGNDDSGNTKLKVHIYHFAKPDSLTPAKGSYVLWVQAKGGDPRNMGAIGVGDNLEGRLDTLTPQKVFDVFITSEDGARVLAPTGDRIVEAQVERK